ncbi:hypothetical protein GIY56_16555 [Paracoccus sp. YIM 132242]|uniref:Uncharacterized protein n=1 Tax=Paracoccus lichenicola TaxID=2665644 RepID=A0A6L6HUP4_9RHOB|nr:hypothetical protein [Paracoccus lichenicola]MTE01903.1 hypothetical protein [Paracoccus lichenicola]
MTGTVLWRCFGAFSWPDEECGHGSLDDVFADGGPLVDGENALDLVEKTLQQAKITAGDAHDGGNSAIIGEIVGVEREAKFLPMPPEHEGQLLSS